MRAVIQLVSEASVQVEGEEIGRIGPGLVILLGVHGDDGPNDADYLAAKIANLRIFADANGLMNLSLLETGGAALVVSQFTLLADCRKGRRPSYGNAAPPEKARELYRCFSRKLRDMGLEVQTGKFQTHMRLSLVNQGPVTITLDSTKLF